MNYFNLEYFQLEKQKDGLYRCKGGHIADILLLGGGTVCLFFLWIRHAFFSLRDGFFDWLEN